MKASRKAFGLLGAEDFQLSPIWLVDLPKLDFATPVAPFDDLQTEAPYVALTAYTLRDGTTLRGYCFIYDCSGHALFGADGQAIRVCDYGHSSPEEASSIASALGRSVEDVFPIRFQVSVKVYGTLPDGEIGVQSNNRWRER
jgi:hypothetical protein